MHRSVWRRAGTVSGELETVSHIVTDFLSKNELDWVKVRTNFSHWLLSTVSSIVSKFIKTWECLIKNGACWKRSKDESGSIIDSAKPFWKMHAIDVKSSTNLKLQVACWESEWFRSSNPLVNSKQTTLVHVPILCNTFTHTKRVPSSTAWQNLFWWERYTHGGWIFRWILNYESYIIEKCYENVEVENSIDNTCNYT